MGLGFIILYILHCYIADLDLLASFKVQHAGLRARIGDILQSGGVGVALEPNLEDIKLESLSNLKLSAKSSAKLFTKLLIGLA